MIKGFVGLQEAKTYSERRVFEEQILQDLCDESLNFLWICTFLYNFFLSILLT